MSIVDPTQGVFEKILEKISDVLNAVSGYFTRYNTTSQTEK